MNSKDSELLEKTIIAYKKQNLKYGFSSRGVFWQNDNTQTARFETLIKGISNRDMKGNISISDFGCGYGAFYKFIKNKQFMTNSTFIGYDIVDSFILEAKKKYPQVEWECSNKLYRKTDYIFISGTFNMAFNHSLDEWEKNIENQLQECFKKVNKALIFNLLYSSDRKIEKGLFYCEIDRVFDYCNKMLGNTIITKTPIAQKDITIFVTK